MAYQHVWWATHEFLREQPLRAYSSKVIPATERDATCLLDEVLGNRIDMVIVEHVTDTHEYK